MFRRIFHRKNRALLSELVRTDFKLRYQGSVLGYAWSVLRPLMLFFILYFVFANILHIGKGVAHYPIYLLLGVVMWSFFTEMTSQSLGSIVGRGSLIRKIRIPRWIIILSTSLSALINLLLNLVVVFVFLFANHVDLHFSAVWLPVLLLEVYVFALGLSLFLAAAYVRFRDLSYIWEVVLQLGFYLTPIIYPLSLVSKVLFKKIIILSPMSQAIQDARHVVVTRQTETISSIYGSGLYRLVPIGISLVIFAGGVIYFRNRSRYFAEEI